MNDYKYLILEALYNKDVISEELYLKCSKPHISGLPYDHNTNDVDKLEERLDEIAIHMVALEHDLAVVSGELEDKQKEKKRCRKRVQ